MKVKLTNDTIVRFAKDAVLEVSEEEGKRLCSMRNAVVVKEKKPAAKAAKKK